MTVLWKAVDGYKEDFPIHFSYPFYVTVLSNGTKQKLYNYLYYPVNSALLWTHPYNCSFNFRSCSRLSLKPPPI